jgi:hypothetical protein
MRKANIMLLSNQCVEYLDNARSIARWRKLITPDVYGVFLQ